MSFEMDEFDPLIDYASQMINAPAARKHLENLRVWVRNEVLPLFATLLFFLIVIVLLQIWMLVRLLNHQAP